MSQVPVACLLNEHIQGCCLCRALLLDQGHSEQQQEACSWLLDTITVTVSCVQQQLTWLLQCSPRSIKALISTSIPDSTLRPSAYAT